MFFTIQTYQHITHMLLNLLLLMTNKFSQVIIFVFEFIFINETLTNKISQVCSFKPNNFYFFLHKNNGDVSSGIVI